ncbi:hypothetical protein C0992_000560 [Termitomyces sp. T32_za158]|nr:hypothetical protein C0992_000560 [Termitomyces sp. T32_za158]
MLTLQFALAAFTAGTLLYTLWVTTLTHVHLAAVAQTSLFIPGFDPQPISADILGVDAQGRTTWALHQGALTDTFEEPSFPGTATLVEGANDAFFTYADPSGLFTVGTECTLSGGLAICSATVSGEPATESDTANFINVQVGTTAVLTSPIVTVPTATSNVSPQSSSETDTSAQTSKNTASTPSPTQSSNAFVNLPHIILGSIASAAIVALAL